MEDLDERRKPMTQRKKGIDVSVYQGDVDWEKVKASGVEFAILRCGYGDDAYFQDDGRFRVNAEACEKIGLPYGVYLYSYADTISHARSEARHALRLLQGRKLSYPVFLDLEDPVTTGKCRESMILSIAKTFVEALEKEGWKAGIYANLSWWRTKLTDPWYRTKPVWLAYWTHAQDPGFACDIWQYSDKGSIPGIRTRVDLDLAFMKPQNSNPPKDPAPDPGWVEYTVRRGDTLWAIARRYHTTYQKIAADNGIPNPNLIYAGQKLKIFPNT